MLHYRHRATDRVTVILRAVEDATGTSRRKLIEAGRVAVTGRISTVSSDEAALLGNAGVCDAVTVKKLRCSSFPGDEHSQVIDGSGVLYDVIAEPRQSAQMQLKPSTSVLLRKVGNG